jgi:LPXTG-motif cell wall-anchored protein
VHRAGQIPQYEVFPATPVRFATYRARRALSVSIIAAGALLFGVGAGAAVASAAGTPYVLSDVQCDPAGNGVLDLTLVNDNDLVEAVFTIDATGTGVGDNVGSTSIAVAPLSAHAVTFTDLLDGDLVVPLQVDGVDASVMVSVACDAPQVASLAATARASNGVTPELPRTGSSTGGLLIGGALVTAGILASLIARRRYS